MTAKNKGGSLLTPTTAGVPSRRPDDPRIGHLLGQGLTSGEPPATVLVGFPCDEGVRRNGGRPGAALAPDVIRSHFYSLTPDSVSCAAFQAVIERTLDLGNIRVSGDLEADQSRLAQVIAPYLTTGVAVIILGGGHETAYGHFQGYVRAEKPLTILNLDAHADVRELIDEKGHSGSSFRQALEHPTKLCRRYTVAGLQRHSNSAAHLEYVRRKGGRFVTARALDLHTLGDLVVGLAPNGIVTFDFDALDQSLAPGVSAPTSGGLNLELWYAAARNAGEHPAVSSIDLVEVNPALDRDHQTSRIAAVTLWHFFLGLCRRAES